MIGKKRPQRRKTSDGDQGCDKGVELYQPSDPCSEVSLSGFLIFCSQFGDSLAYANCSGTGGAATPQIVFNAVVPSDAEITVMLEKKCKETSCVQLRRHHSENISWCGAQGLGNSMARACVEGGAKAIVIFHADPDLGVESAAELHKATISTIQPTSLQQSRGVNEGL
ncbi:hypothetical protein HYFRA_00009514 [Hymenoscyphus fraxineus]|uniref:Cell wall protein YJL171C/Tos1 C-terminal domain-containing protein n=1 Tax=Hymenoscyphus fraxineus TaxID=746836 RepID=A0A9N9L0N2_9HELO|nr:hypothetical protein HYFRA_00009514 [Hymenoscyphus fraxineus]